MLSAFNPHELPEKTVRAVATGREAPLAEILGDIRKNLAGGTMQHLIVSAPRGYGKSFLMRHVQIEAERIAREENLALAVLLMPEEMPHVKLPETLLNELTRALTGGAAGEAKLAWVEDDEEAFEEAATALKAAIRAKVGEHGLCVAMVENFDRLLRLAFPHERHRQKLRAFLTAPDTRLMLIAASASGAFDRDYDASFFLAFKEVELLPWSPDECMAFFDRQRRDAGKPPLDERMRARAMAVSLFIGGTPRLATLLGDLLLGDDLLGAAELLRRLIDEMTPYYKERIDALPHRAQVLLDALLRGGEPATQSELARRVEAKRGQAAIAGPFADLIKERIVFGGKATGSAEVLYRVADRVFAHYYRFRVIEHGKALCPLEALVDLLAEYFTPEEKRGKAAEFARLGRLEEARVMARLADFDSGQTKAQRYSILYALDQYFVPRRLAPKVGAATATILQNCARAARGGDIERARAALVGLLGAAAPIEDRLAALMARSHLDAYEGFDSGLDAAEQAFAFADECSDPGLRWEAQLMRARRLRESGRLESALEAAREVARKAQAHGALEMLARASVQAAIALLRLQRFAEAFNEAQAAEETCRAADLPRNEAEALRAQAGCRQELGDLEGALALAQRATKAMQRGGEGPERFHAHFQVADILISLKRSAEASDSYARAAEAALAIEWAWAQAQSLAWRAVALCRAQAFAAALEIAEAATSLAEPIGATEQMRVASFAAGWALNNQHEFAESAKRLLSIATLAQTKREPQFEVACYGLAAWSLFDACRPDDGLDMLVRVAEVLASHPDPSETEALETEASFHGGRLDPAEDFDVRLADIARRLAASPPAATALTCFVAGFVDATLRRETAPERLESLARSLGIHLPGRCDDLRERLSAAAAYHAAGRAASALERIDPDFASALKTMHPPAEPQADNKAPRKRR